MGQSDPQDRMATDRARRLRRDATDAEAAMWRLLRASQLAGAKFRRQRPIGPYIVDFICLKLDLIIEVDGVSHDARLDADARRERHLAEMGYEVLRFTNSDVLWDMDAVVLAIVNRVDEIVGGGGRPLP